MYRKVSTESNDPQIAASHGDIFKPFIQIRKATSDRLQSQESQLRKSSKQRTPTQSSRGFIASPVMTKNKLKRFNSRIKSLGSINGLNNPGLVNLRNIVSPLANLQAPKSKKEAKSRGSSIDQINNIDYLGTCKKGRKEPPTLIKKNIRLINQVRVQNQELAKQKERILRIKNKNKDSQVVKSLNSPVKSLNYKKKKAVEMVVAAFKLKSQIAMYNQAMEVKDTEKQKKAIDQIFKQQCTTKSPFELTENVLQKASEPQNRRKNSSVQSRKVPTVKSLNKMATQLYNKLKTNFSSSNEGKRISSSKNVKHQYNSSNNFGVKSSQQYSQDSRYLGPAGQSLVQQVSVDLKQANSVTNSDEYTTSRQLQELQKLKHYGKRKVQQMIGKVKNSIEFTNSQLMREGVIMGMEKPPDTTFQQAQTSRAAEEQKQKNTSLIQRMKKKKFLRNFIDAAKQMKEMRINPQDFTQKKLFPTKPFERPNSKALIYSAKCGDVDKLKEILYENKLLVYDFDNVHQTALHWAAKRNFVPVIRVLIENGANVNAFDMAKRTPLFLAAKCGSIGATKALLSAKANPFYLSNCKYSPIDVAKKPIIAALIKRAQTVCQLLLHMYLKMLKPNQRDREWTDSTTKYFTHDLEDDKIPQQFPDFKAEASQDELQEDNQRDEHQQKTQVSQTNNSQMQIKQFKSDFFQAAGGFSSSLAQIKKF